MNPSWLIFFKWVGSTTNQKILPSGKLTWLAGKMDHEWRCFFLYFLLNMVIFHCNVSLLEGIGNAVFGAMKAVQDLHWLRSLKNNLRSEDVMGMWPSSSISLCYLIYWQLGAKGSKDIGKWKMRVHRCDTCLLMLDVDFFGLSWLVGWLGGQIKFSYIYSCELWLKQALVKESSGTSDFIGGDLKKKTSDFIGGDLKHFWWSVVFRNGKNLHQNKLFHGLQTVRFLNGRNLLQKKILCLIGPYFLFENLQQNRQLTHWWNWLSILLLNTILKSRQCQIFDGTETLRQPPLQRSQTRSNKRLIYSGFSWFSLWLHIAICIHRQPAVLTKSNINKFPMMKSLALQTVENLRNHTWMMPAARSIGCTWRLGCSSSTSWINRQMWISHRAWSNAKMPSIGGLRIRGLHRNCIPISDPIKVKWLLRHLGFSWLTLFESGELCISHLNRVSPVSPVHVSVTSMWATAWIYQLEVVFGKWVFIRVNRLCWLSQFSIYRWIYHSFSLI